MLNDPTNTHLALGCAAFFVGSYQLVIRWLWAGYFPERDQLALRAWAMSTALTAYIIGWVVFKFSHDELGIWFEIALLITGAQAYSAMSATLALRAWGRDGNIRARPIP